MEIRVDTGWKLVWKLGWESGLGFGSREELNNRLGGNLLLKGTQRTNGPSERSLGVIHRETCQI